MRVGVTGKLVVKMNIPVAVRNATTLCLSQRQFAPPPGRGPARMHGPWAPFRTCMLSNYEKITTTCCMQVLKGMARNTEKIPRLDGRDYRVHYNRVRRVYGAILAPPPTGLPRGRAKERQHRVGGADGEHGLGRVEAQRGDGPDARAEEAVKVADRRDFAHAAGWF